MKGRKRRKVLPQTSTKMNVDTVAEDKEQDDDAIEMSTAIQNK